MTQRTAPFEEMQDGLPLWRIQVEDPNDAVDEKRELNWRVLDFPDGRVFALVLRVYDGVGKPVIFHHAMLMGGTAFQNLKSAGAMTLVFERRGFMGDARAKVELNLAPLQTGPAGNPSALESYVAAYRGGIARTGSPEGAWDAIEAGEMAGRGSKLVWVLVFLLLAALGGLAYYFFETGHAAVFLDISRF